MDLSYLASLSQSEFEFERCRLIAAELDKAPTPDMRIKALAAQMALDIRRSTMSSDQFMASIFIDLQENLENLSDQFMVIKHCLVPKNQ